MTHRNLKESRVQLAGMLLIAAASPGAADGETCLTAAPSWEPLS